MLYLLLCYQTGRLWWLSGKESGCNAEDQIRSVTQSCPTLCDPMNRSMPGLPVHHQLQCRRHRLNPWVGNIPCRRKWQPTPAFLPGEIHGQRSLVGSQRVPHGISKSSGRTEQLTHIKYKNRFLMCMLFCDQLVHLVA